MIEPGPTLALNADSSAYIALQKSSYITKTARSVTVANIFAPLLCIPLFYEDVDTLKFGIWLTCMMLATAFRTWATHRLEHEADKIVDPQRNLSVVTLGVGLIGVGWGLGWLLLAPDLSMENRMIYLYILTGGMFNSMFGYCVHWPTFYSFTIPIMLPAILMAFFPPYIFPWPFALGIATLFIYVIRISRNFSRTYEDSIRLRLRNEQLYSDLAAERDASISANVAKSNFIASASHDLRQPLHAVNIYLDHLRLDKMEPSEQRTLQKIKGSITVLNDMFESLLNISRLDSYSFTPSQDDFSLKQLAQALDEIARPLAAQKQLHLQFQGAQGRVRGDLHVLQQILMNLLTNAIFYTQRGEVQVRFFLESTGLVVRVSDTGCGIAAEEHERVFDEFYRVNRTRAQHDGLGLGLSIVKRLCALIDAQVQLESQIDQGTVFTIRTPYRALQGLALEPPAASPAAQEALSLHGRVVALIEDDPVVCQAYRQALAGRGAVVVVMPEDAQKMQAALSSLDRLDLIISDYRLQTTFGDTLIQRLRESFNEDIPAIIVTADTSPAHIDHFERLGIPVLHKPVSFRRVVDTAERVLRAATRGG